MTTIMQTRPSSLLFAAALALTALPVSAQEERKPAPPAPPAPSEVERPREPERPQPLPPGRGGPREDRFDGRGEPRRDGPRPDDGRRHEHEEGPRREGERGPGPGGPRDRMFNIPLLPPAPAVPTPYIGVVTVSPPAALGAQLGLKEGFGLVVNEVLPDSPAAKAGLQKHDVLTMFNDQQLVDAGQFATLVRAAGKDTDATLTLLRAAKEQKVSVKIGERMAPQRMTLPGGNELREQFERFKGPAQESLRKFQDKMKEYGEKMREYQERLKNWQKNPSEQMPQPPAPPALEPEHAGVRIDPADVLVQAQPGGPRKIRFWHPDGAVSYNTADAKVFIKDDNGEIEMSSKDGKRVVVAKDARGVVMFEGPIDTEEERKALPEKVRRKLDSIQVRGVGAGAAVEAPVVLRLPPGADDVQ
jgi:hypothetical protein